MIMNSMLLAFRQLRKRPATSLFNLACLAIGMATFTLIVFYIQKEKSYDRYHLRPDLLYRVVNNYTVGNESITTTWTPAALGGAIQHEVAAVTEAVRLFRYRSPCVMVIKGTNKNFTEENSIWVDANVFRVFRFTFVKGDPDQALRRPNTMVITEDIAQKYFGSEDPMGKTISDLTM